METKEKTGTEVLIPEIVKEETPNLPQETSKGKSGKKKGDTRGRLSIKYRKIAEMAARGWGIDLMAKEVHLSVSRIYIILKTNDQVWEYVTEIIQNTFSEGDRILATLYKKAMIGIDEDLSSGDPDVRYKTREQVLKLWGYTKGMGKVEGGTQFNLIQQFFQGNKGGVVQSMDEIILQKRKERGLLTSEETDQEDEDEQNENR